MADTLSDKAAEAVARRLPIAVANLARLVAAGQTVVREKELLTFCKLSEIATLEAGGLIHDAPEYSRSHRIASSIARSRASGLNRLYTPPMSRRDVFTINGRVLALADAAGESVAGDTTRDQRPTEQADEAPKSDEKANTKPNTRKKALASPVDPSLTEFLNILKQTVRRNSRRAPGQKRTEYIAAARDFIADKGVDQDPKTLMAQARRYRHLWCDE